MTSGHEVELSLRRRPRVRLVGLETLREKPRWGISTEEQPVQNRGPPSYEIAQQNSKPQVGLWEPLVPHGSLSPAEEYVGKDLGGCGEEKERMCSPPPFPWRASALHSE